jgi:DNA-binding beta-propeller fold protein YncE
MNGVEDVLLTPSKELFLLFRTAARDSGWVEEWALGLGSRLSTRFPGVSNAAAIAFGANQLFVLDQGGTAAARVTRATEYQSDCGPVQVFNRPIANVSRYLHVRAFNLNGAAAGSFTDTSFLWVNGIAADAAGRVYVGGILGLCIVDPFNPFIRTFGSEFRIRRYERGTNDGSVIGTGWRRDPSYELVEGTGIGSTRDPRGMHWAMTEGSALYFADAGNQEVQKFADPASGGSSFKIDFGGSGADSLHLDDPIDVAVDSAGYIYVADLGNTRVLRYDPNGNFVQPVDIEGDGTGDLVRPIAVAADNEEVFVADPARTVVVRYRRRK